MTGRERIMVVFAGIETGAEGGAVNEQEKEKEWFDDLMGSVMNEGKGEGKEQFEQWESLKEDFDKEPFPKLQEELEEFPTLPEQEPPAEVAQHLAPVTTRRRGRSVMVLSPPTGGGVMVLPAPTDEQPNPQLQLRDQELPPFRPHTPAPRRSAVLPPPANFEEPSHQLPPIRPGTPAPHSSRIALPPPSIPQEAPQSQRQGPPAALPTRTRGRSQSIILPPPAPGVSVLDWQAQFQLPAMQSQPSSTTTTTTTSTTMSTTTSTAASSSSAFPHHSRPRAASVVPATTPRYNLQPLSLALLPQATSSVFVTEEDSWAMKEARRNNLAARLDALQRRARAKGTSAWQRGRDIQDSKTGNPVKMILDRMPVGFCITGPRLRRGDPAW